MTAEKLELVWPANEYLSSYIEALERGWSPDTLRPEASVEYLERINHDPQLFLTQQVDRDAKQPPILLPDGSTIPRLPGFVQWMWDGEFCGQIGLRWQPGTNELPSHVLGHVGYSVVPWKQRQGMATQALKMFLPQVKNEGLTQVEIVTLTSNVASQRVIEANGGRLIEQFKSPQHDSEDRFRYLVELGS